MSDIESEAQKSVKTYVPAYQKAEWKNHANELDMSLSEFVRTMVQGGRRTFEEDPLHGDDTDATPGVKPLETAILDSLTESTSKSFDEIVSDVSGDLEAEIESIIENLRENGTITQTVRGELRISRTGE